MSPVNERRCHTCGEPRGKRGERSGWHREHDDSWACPECPHMREPIRRIESRGRIRYRTVLDVSREGAARRQETKTHDSLADAREHIERTRDHVRRGTYSRDTVATLAERWLASRDDVRRVTVEGYRHALRPVLVFMGDKAVTDVGPRDVSAFIRWAGAEGGKSGKPLSPRSVRYAVVAMRQAFARAVEEEAIPRNPVPEQTRTKRQAPQIAEARHYWTREQVAAFRAVADADALAGAWRLSLCGMTRADVHGLRWDDIDMTAGLATVRRGRVAVDGGETVTDEPKSAQRRRTLPIERVEPGSMALLRSLRAAQAADRLRAGEAWQESGYVLVDALGAPMHPERYSERFRRLSREAGLPSIRLHALRHSLAHWFDSIGVTPSAGAAWLGHTTPVYLSVYFPERGADGIAEAAEVMARATA